MIDLLKKQWQLAGWRPYAWMMRQSLETGDFHQPEIGPVAATVPGSAHTALLASRLIEDWNVGLNSNKCEWLEHRHWEFSTELAPVTPGTAVRLDADGLDHSGWILIDASIVAAFEGSLVRHRFDLTAHLADGRPHRLSIVFDEPPREQGQIGLTSRSKHFKPRFSYSWDWCPRIVPIGIWDTLLLRYDPPPIEITSIMTRMADDGATGLITLNTRSTAGEAVLLQVVVRDGAGNDVLAAEAPAGPGADVLELAVPAVAPWWPNGEGSQTLYDLEVAGAGDSQTLFNGTIGFKRIRWLPCDGAPPGAEPWICEINGRSIFLEGVNWTPLSPDYATVTRADYAKLIDLYKAMNINLLRVWGGAFLEKQDFYELCDQAGILVWQEFPLSSSGYDNYAPDDPAVIDNLCTIATDYVRRRGHHACKLMWCGGNELLGVPGQPGGVPHDRSHPSLAALAEVVRREDPHTRYIPTSPSGPSFSADEQDFGKGIHHDVHGPWKLWGTILAWQDYWQRDDALFRSEVGMPGASGIDILEHFSGDCSPWPPSPDNPYWRHGAAWWIQWDELREEIEPLPPDEGLKRYVELSQKRQAEALATAAAACKGRFPRCGGFLVWMGHDCFPCPANTAIIDFLGRPKPAYHALAEVFGRP